MASATDLPVLLYDIPVRTGRRIESATVLALARDVPNIVGVKDAAADVVGAARTIARAPAGFDWYSGDDAYTLPLLSVGAVGVVSVAGHWIGPALGQLVAAFRRGDVDAARAVNASLLDAVGFQSSDAHPNPVPAKAVCRALGLPVGQCRLPMGAAGADLDDRARALVAELGIAVAGGVGGAGG